MKNDSLGDRMKSYESHYSRAKLLPLLPIVARMDGRAFHTFTRGLARPFDERLSNLMVATTKYLVESTGASVGYTQSDEISLIWQNEDREPQVLFDAKLLKTTSILASMTTACFNRNLPTYLPEKANEMPLFDARIFVVPNKVEATNYLIWRELDATRNSISMAAQSMFLHKELHKKSSSMMQEMMFSKFGVNWNDYPSFFKRGTYIKRLNIEKPFTTEEIDKLPEKHLARRNPDLKVTRQETAIIDLPPLRRIENRKEVIFEGATPILRES